MLESKQVCVCLNLTKTIYLLQNALFTTKLYKVVLFITRKINNINGNKANNNNNNNNI